MQRHITYANVVATLALFLAIGGGAYAVNGGAAAKGRRYVACVAKRSGVMRLVTTAKACRRRTERAIVWNQTGPRGLRGSQGSQGEAGVPGAPGLDGKQGVPGPAGATKVVVRSGTSQVSCAAGEKAVGGGGAVDDQGVTSPTGAALIATQPLIANGLPTGWKVTGQTSGLPFQLADSVYAICASP